MNSSFILHQSKIQMIHLLRLATKLMVSADDGPPPKTKDSAAWLMAFRNSVVVKVVSET